MTQPTLRGRSARVRPYLPALEPPTAPVPGLLFRVLHGLRRLPDHRPPQVPHGSHDDRTPLVRLIDAQKARTVTDRTPTEEIPIVTAEGVSRR